MATSSYELELSKSAGHQTVYEASQAEVSKLWQVGVSCSDAIGTGRYQYNMLDSFGGKTVTRFLRLLGNA